MVNTSLTDLIIYVVCLPKDIVMEGEIIHQVCRAI